ncbi:MAG: hypothetical protein LUI02_02990 [Clostridiales bacterium]|nr:hypothetical protein [Clostridiales bacterium]
MRIWFKLWKNSRMTGSEVIEDSSDETRTHKVFSALDTACKRFDLEKPIWLDSNVEEFQRRARTRFSGDNFIEEIPFDYLEIHVIEED